MKEGGRTKGLSFLWKVKFQGQKKWIRLWKSYIGALQMQEETGHKFLHPEKSDVL